MTATLAGMSPLRANATVLPITDLQLPPEVQAQTFRHSGNEFGSVGVVPGADPRVRFKTPLSVAYALIGLKGLMVTTALDIYLATFASGLRQGGANHSKWALASGAKAFMHILGGSVAQNGIVLADVEAVLLSSDGRTHPFAPLAAGQTLPSLGNEPQLHTMGPFVLEGSRIDGATNVGFKQNANLYVPHHDGDTFARTCAWINADPELMIEHEDPVTLLTSLGLMGANIVTPAQVWFRGIDPTTQLTQTTGFSLTTASGRPIPSPVQFDLNKPAKTGVMVKTLSSSSTHPLTVATAGSVP